MVWQLLKMLNHYTGGSCTGYTVKTKLREVFEKYFNLKQKCLAATEISHAVFHNSDTEC